MVTLCVPRGDLYGRAASFVWTYSGELPIRLDSQFQQLAAHRYPNQLGRTAMDGRSGSTCERCRAQEKTLTDEESRQALAAFKQFGLWQKSSVACAPDVHDGAVWFVEGRHGTAYRGVLRANADEEALRELALTLFKISGMDPGRIRRRG